MTIYKLTFLRDAKKEWDRLGGDIRKQFERKLSEVIKAPRRPAARLSAMPDCYKIKLRSVGYQLVYRVYDDRVVVQVIAVGRPDRNFVYNAAAVRLKN